MEAYTAADERPVVTCLRDVADLDIYIGIIGMAVQLHPSR
jgi:hypothetical protein